MSTNFQINISILANLFMTNKIKFMVMNFYYGNTIIHTNKWQLPRNVVDFPLSKIVSTIQEINPQLKDIANLSLNMTVSQITDFRAEYFFTWVLGTTNIKQLVIELDANDIRRANIFKRKEILYILRKIKRLQIKVTIENVDSSKKHTIQKHTICYSSICHILTI